MTPTGQRDSMPVPSQEDLSISAARGERGKSDAQPRIQFKLTGQPARTTTTLGDLHRATPWLWLYCEKCRHSAPIACAVPVIRWGPNTSSDKLRRCARCTACGHKGATLQHPGWGGADVGFLPFPMHLLGAVEWR